MKQSNISVHVVKNGSDGVEFDFRHNSRLSKQVVQSLKDTIRETCSVIPNGIVVFVTSFAYLEALLSAWSNAHTKRNAFMDFFSQA